MIDQEDLDSDDDGLEVVSWLVSVFAETLGARADLRTPLRADGWSP